ncbi:PTS system mannose/fructose/sorbose family transporter subunit IID [Desulfovibrio mangrovi]|uniref:PTS system mannose/fructose/sorbose family transporter subunit IID n=1 Tax=Desulfovibrio mangrovi TaxID=2976983 RepID=UPI00224652CC|nr:PTS system mannose/fructose/sorbose family transporter subunit IID [Desulfovibrio mangrovi]UZP69193.1 PTS system mannose/fructose/sorbose family transporter subunit IID [Desulfovibrio mangrovi]
MTDARTLLRCFLRTYLVGAAFNTRGLQNVGIVYAMEPGLRAIYPDPKQRRDARKRYLKHYNTHPFWTPLLVGTFLSLEALIARGKAPAEMLTALKDTTTYTLSAIGDSVFGGSFLVFWSLTTTCMLVADMHWVALCWSLMLFLTLHAFKLFTFAAGLRGGLKVLNMLKNWDLINWGERLKLANAVVLVILLYEVWPWAHLESIWGYSWELAWGLASAGLCLAGWILGRFHLSRIILLFILALAALIVPMLTGYFSSGM